MKKALLLLCGVLMVFASASAREPRTRAERLLAELRNPKSKYVFVAAHRGDWRNWPENSIEAMHSAVAMGVDILEIDVAMTKDSVLIVMHDRKLDRTTRMKGYVKDYLWKDLCTHHLRSGTGSSTDILIPTLESLFVACKDMAIINIDGTNAWPYFEEIYALAKRHDMVDQVLFKGGRGITIDYLKERDMLYMPIVGASSPHGKKAIEKYLAGYPCIGYEMCMNRKVTDDDRIYFRKILEGGSLPMVSTLWLSSGGGYSDDRAAREGCDKIYGPLLDMGTRIIQTDRPALLIDYLKKCGLRKMKERK